MAETLTATAPSSAKAMEGRPAAPAAPAAAAPPISNLKSQISNPPAAGARAPLAKNMADAFSKLDTMAGTAPAEDSFGKNQPKAPGDKTPQSARDKNTPPADLDDEPAASSSAEATEDRPIEPPKTEDAPLKPPKAATLREAHDRMKAENAALQKKIADYEAEKARAPVEDVEKRKLGETLAQRDKRLAELEDDLRFTNYERSAEYREKYETPFIDAFTAGRNKTASLNAMDGEGAARKGTADDFDALMRITDDGAAADKAVEMFGNQAPMVLFHREKVQELNSGRLKALDHYKKEGKNLEAQRAETSKAALEKTSAEAKAAWAKYYSEPHEKLPQYFKPIEGDTKGNELLDNGFAQTARAFKNMNAMDPRLSPADREQVIKGHAIVFNKAAAFDRLAHLYHSEKSQRAALEAKLKEFEASAPGAGDARGKGGKAAGASTMDAALDQLQKLAR